MNNKNKKRLAIFAILLALLALGYFFWTNFKNKQTNAANQGALEVTVVKVVKQNNQLFTELAGRVSSYKISEVRPQVDGVIKQIKFVEGSFVKKGQQLYQIDPIVYQAAFDNANQNFKALTAKKERYDELIKEDIISKQEYDDIKASFTQAQSDFKKAKANLDYSKVYAPISGYIGKSNITEGALVTANQAQILTTITELDPIYVDLVQPTKEMIKFGDQKNAVVTLITDNGVYEEKGSLKFSEVFADESTDSVRLRALFSNKNKKLIPGMFVAAKLHLKPIESLTVPQRATNRAPDGSLIVWVVDQNNVVKPRPIKADQIIGDSWIVEDGLVDGDIIVYEGFQKIADGAKVKPVMLVSEEKK